MNPKQSKLLDKKKIVASLAVVSALAATGYEVNRLSADPIGEKDCPPAETALPSECFGHGADQRGDRSLSVGEMLKWEQRRDDQRCQLFGSHARVWILKITSVDDIRTLAFARENKLRCRWRA
jgi:hypothetical protein